MIYEKNDIRNLIFGLCNNYASMNKEDIDSITKFANWCDKYVDDERIIKNEIKEGEPIGNRLKYHKGLFLRCNDKLEHTNNTCLCKHKKHI